MPDDMPSAAISRSIRFRAGMWPAWIALVCSLALTVVAWRYTQQSLQHQLRLEFDAEVGEMRADLNARIAGYTRVLRGAAALFAVRGEVTRKDWHDYVTALRLERDYPAMQALAFARSVSADELPALVSEVRRSGVAGFAVRPPGRRDHYVVNIFAEPYSGLNITALGYDMWQDAARRETMQRATDTGEPTITGKLTLKVDAQSSPLPAFIMYLPVASKSGDGVYGYVLSPFHMPDLLADLLKRSHGGVSLTVHDGTATSAENLYYRNTAEGDALPAKFLRSEILSIGGRPWTLTWASQPQLEARVDMSRAGQVLAGGLLTSLLLFAVAWSLAATRDRALRLARDMTHSLRESEARFRVLVEQAPDAIVVYDPDLDRFVEANAQAEKLFGCNREELLAGGVGRFLPPGLFDGKTAAENVKDMLERTVAGDQVVFERSICNAQGRTLRCELRLIRLPAAGHRLIRGSLIDITERKAAEDEIRHLAFYDALTGLPNRRLMYDRLGQALTSSARHDRHGALILFDLDDFKTLNDTLGHDVGDQFLVEVASRLAASIREVDTVARLGGDEFVIILEDLDAEALAAMQAESVAVKIQVALNRPYLLDVSLAGGDTNTRSYHCTASIGITLFRDQSVTVDELMKRADTAMYQAKAAGRNTLRFFDPEMQAAVAARAALDADLRRAIGDRQFVLHYQPQVDGDGRVTGAEALVRWQHPRRGLLYPAEFIRQAEATQLIIPLSQWVLETACSQLAAWRGQAEMKHLVVAVNVSGRHFRQPNFVEQVLAVLSQTGADPQRLQLEVTESLLLHDIEDVVAKMTALKTAGVSFSLDDFGTGYSSLFQLKRLPLAQLKIDQSFVRDVLTDSNDAAIARTVIALGLSLGLTVIAEGVETAGQREFLARQGCHTYQGNLFGVPGAVADLFMGSKAEA